MQIDYGPLTSEVTNDDIKSYKKQNKDTKLSKFILIFISAIVVIAISIIIDGFYSEIDLKYAPYSILPILLFVLVMFGVAYKGKHDMANTIRLERFANSNNLSYTPFLTSPDVEGMIFKVGSGRYSCDILTSKSVNIFEIGNHSYTIGSGDNKKNINTGYLKIHLNRKLPHMVLDSRKNNTNILGISISNLPVSFYQDQVLSLEGDFNTSFTLYAPKDYERDALYVFSPDLMALFIDTLGNFDAEIVDDNLFVYSQKPFELLDQALLEHLFKIISIVGAKTISQTDKYYDEKVESKNDATITESGRRLKRRIPKEVIIATLAFLAFFGLNVLVPYVPDIVKFFMK